MSACNDALLWTLVEQSAEPSGEFESIARHIESCAGCREKLSEMGGDLSWWKEASEYLSVSPEELPRARSNESVSVNQVDDCPADSPDTESLNDESTSESASGIEDDDDNIPLPPVDLSFLSDSSHPEMLGRIGRYDVEGLLGRGGMGVVLRGYDADLHRSIAIKVLAPEWAASLQARRRFAREAQAAASVAHQNVVPIYNVEADAALPYLVMAYIPGMTLERWVRSNQIPDAPTLLRVAGQLTDGLAAAHRRGLIHRDIKPGNILVGENIDRVWITDFGLARAADSVTLTRTGVIAGTPHYMSPEQARGESIDQRSDLFSLGCVLYFLAAGVPPFDAENTLAVLHKIVSSNPESLAAKRRDLPPSFVSLVERLLERRVDRRPRDCDDVATRLLSASEELEGGRIAPEPKLVRRRRLLVGLPALLLAVAFGWAPVSRWLAREDSSMTRDGIVSARTSGSNPWSFGAEARIDASPYVRGASAEIDASLLTGMDALTKELSDQQASAETLLAEESDLLAPSMSFGNANWRSRVDRIEEEIRRLRARLRPSPNPFHFSP